ncbi:MAG: FMN-binding protein [Halanaerobium sp.]|nr:FMN-binding protein [Halanaerobium sp.]
MMRRKSRLAFTLIFILSILLIVFALGCGQRDEEEEEEVAPANKYTDGTYTAYSDATDNGYAWAKVTVKDDNITRVELMEITSKGNEKDYETYDYEPSVKAYEEMPERFEEADSAEVEIYSGATHSSEKYKQAVSRALDYARGGLSGTYFAGMFQGQSEKTENGYAIALVTIKDDKITAVELKEIGKDGEFKDFANYEYEPAVEANAEMPQRFVEANSYDVDIYSGATHSSENYQAAVKSALEHARKNPDKEVE